MMSASEVKRPTTMMIQDEVGGGESPGAEVGGGLCPAGKKAVVDGRRKPHDPIGPADRAVTLGFAGSIMGVPSWPRCGRRWHEVSCPAKSRVHNGARPEAEPFRHEQDADTESVPLAIEPPRRRGPAQARRGSRLAICARARSRRPASQHRRRTHAATRSWAYWPTPRASSETVCSSELPPSSPSFAEIIDDSLKGVRAPTAALPLVSSLPMRSRSESVSPSPLWCRAPAAAPPITPTPIAAGPRRNSAAPIPAPLPVLRAPTFSSSFSFPVASTARTPMASVEVSPESFRAALRRLRLPRPRRSRGPASCLPLR